jgi:KTSC domain
MERGERQRLQAVEAHPSMELREGFRRPGQWYEAPSGPHGLQGPNSPSPDLDPTTNVPDWDYYWPTRTINPPRPRTLQARYSARKQRIEVIFREGSPASPDATWHYDNVPPEVWMGFKRAESPGRFINSTLNYFPYGAGGWGTLVGQ